VARQRAGLQLREDAGKSLRFIASDPTERKYLRWFLEGTFDEDAKGIVRDALQRRIRRRPSHRRRAG
jgi:hypothetical protein